MQTYKLTWQTNKQGWPNYALSERIVTTYGAKIIHTYVWRIFLFFSNYFLIHYLITIDDRFGHLVLMSVLQIPNKFFQNLTKPLQCYTNWCARYIYNIHTYIQEVCFTKTPPRPISRHAFWIQTFWLSRLDVYCVYRSDGILRKIISKKTKWRKSKWLQPSSDCTKIIKIFLSYRQYITNDVHYVERKL